MIAVISTRSTIAGQVLPILLRAGFCAGVLAMVGCQSRLSVKYPTHPQPLGSITDRILLQQEDNAEAAKFVIYMHEFELNKPEWELRLNRPWNGPSRGYRLSPNGEDHIRRIAAMIHEGRSYPVVIERSQTSTRGVTEHKYPVHFNDELDLRRRDVVVQALKMFGVADAESRVTVGPSFSEGMDSATAARAYATSRMNRRGAGGAGGGGGATSARSGF